MNIFLSLSCLDIVQEGLDIPTCSYVIRYEFVSDEIGTIQSRGRARAQDSAYYLITEQDSTNHKREKDNKSREDDMEEAIKQWPQIDKNIFARDVDNKTVNMKIFTISNMNYFLFSRNPLSPDGTKR
jgi:ERCC4-related helicase